MKSASALFRAAVPVAAALSFVTPAFGQTYAASTRVEDVGGSVSVLTGTAAGLSAADLEITPGLLLSSTELPVTIGGFYQVNSDQITSKETYPGGQTSVTVPGGGRSVQASVLSSVSTAYRAEAYISFSGASIRHTVDDTELLTISVSRTSPGMALTTVELSDSGFAHPNLVSNFVGSSTLSEYITLSVLGVSVPIPDLSDGETSVNFQVPVNSGAAAANAIFTLRPNVIGISGDASHVSAYAAALEVEFWISYTPDPVSGGGLTGAISEGTIAFGAVSASITATPVPEPSGAVLLLTGSAILLRRRRR